MITLLLLFAILLIPYLIGLPITTWLLSKSDRSREELTIYSFFTGISLLILGQQTFIFLGFSTILLSKILLVLAVASWFISGPKKTFSFLSFRVFWFSYAVYLAHCAGILIKGLKTYVGRAWIDQYNYVTMTQTLIETFYGSTTTNRPYLFDGQTFLQDRIGQAILHSFYSVIFNLDPKFIFEPLILLSGPMIALIVYLILKKTQESDRYSYFLAAVISLLPGITYLNLECFLSQALGGPFLFLFAIVFFEYLETVKKNHLAPELFLASLFCATGLSIYTEYLFFFLLLFLIEPLIQSYFNKIPNRHLLIRTMAVVLLAILLNPIYFPKIIYICQRTVSSGVLKGIFPFAFSETGIARLLIGDWAHRTTAFVNKLMFLIVLSSLILFLIKGDLKKISRHIFLYPIHALCLIPIVIYLLKGSDFEYQFYKLILAVSPLYFIGIRFIPGIKLKKLAVFTLTAIVLFAHSDLIYATINLTEVTARGRGGAAALLKPTVIQAEQYLETLRNKNVFIFWHDSILYEGAYLSAWFYYFAKHNQIWSLSIGLSDRFILNDKLPAPLPGIPCVFLTSKAIPSLANTLVQNFDNEIIIYEINFLKCAQSYEEIRKLY